MQRKRPPILRARIALCATTSTSASRRCRRRCGAIDPQTCKPRHEPAEILGDALGRADDQGPTGLQLVAKKLQHASPERIIEVREHEIATKNEMEAALGHGHSNVLDLELDVMPVVVGEPQTPGRAGEGRREIEWQIPQSMGGVARPGRLFDHLGLEASVAMMRMRTPGNRGATCSRQRIATVAGFDAVYRRDAHDNELAEIACRERRILLTGDRGLLKRRVVVHGYFIRQTATYRQFVEVLARFSPPAARAVTVAARPSTIPDEA
jgi:Mut7-C RNAse domain